MDYDSYLASLVEDYMNDETEEEYNERQDDIMNEAYDSYKDDMAVLQAEMDEQTLWEI